MAQAALKNWAALGFPSRRAMEDAVAGLFLVTAEDRKRWDAFRRRNRDADVNYADNLAALDVPRRAHGARSNPYFLEGPAVVAFSGGRTSGYLLWHILQAHGGTLPEDVVVSYQNTGMEYRQTLDFVHACETAWEVDIHWLEWVRPENPAGPPKDFRVRRVDHTTAFSADDPDVRPDGTERPFYGLLRHLARYREAEGRGGPILPNRVQRFCTGTLKMKVAGNYARAVFGWDWWTNAVGLRADEPARVAGVHLADRRTGQESYCPLAHAGVTERNVLDFWREQPFDLRLKPRESNCTLCPLKSMKGRLVILQERPQDAAWWMAQEEWAGTPFVKNRPDYKALLARAAAMSADEIEALIDDGSVPCTCTD